MLSAARRLATTLGGIFLLASLAVALAFPGKESAADVLLELLSSSLLLVPMAVLWLSSVLERGFAGLGATESLRVMLEEHGDRHAAYVIIPAILGLIPANGGVIFSCYLIEETARGGGLPPVHVAALNYWFRHFRAFLNLVMPCVVLASAIAGCSFPALLLPLVPLAVFMLLWGWVFFIRRTPPGERRAA